jgi:hypothetical protein
MTLATSSTISTQRHSSTRPRGEHQAYFKPTSVGGVTSSSLINGLAEPDLIAFRIVQDSIGGRAFAWPANVHGAPEVNPVPHAATLQLFALNTDGALDAIGVATYITQAGN